MSEQHIPIIPDADLGAIANAIQGLNPTVPSFISDAFSVERNYSTGDIVIYENKVYIFTSNKSAGAWDSTKVTETTIGAICTATNSSLANKLSKEWTQITGTISENQNIPIGNDYTEIHVDGAMSNGTVLQFDIQIIPNYGTIRRDEGYYYNSTTCGGGAVSFNTSTRNLVIYSPYMGGSASSYSAIKVFVR